MHACMHAYIRTKVKDTRQKFCHKAIEESRGQGYRSKAALMKVAVADASLSQPDREIVNAHFEEVMSVSDLADKAFIATGNAATTSASIKCAWQCVLS